MGDDLDEHPSLTQVVLVKRQATRNRRIDVVLAELRSG